VQLLLVNSGLDFQLVVNAGGDSFEFENNLP